MQSFYVLFWQIYEHGLQKFYSNLTGLFTYNWEIVWSGSDALLVWLEVARRAGYIETQGADIAAQMSNLDKRMFNITFLRQLH